jgi:hypothetical protein
MRPFPKEELRSVVRWIVEWALEPGGEAVTAEVRIETMPGSGSLSETAVADETSRRVNVMAVEAQLGQPVKALVKMFDANGQETDSYDKMTGIKYTSRNPDVATIVDEDAEPKDAMIQTLSLGEVQFDVIFDGDPGDGVREIALLSDVLRVVPVPPGEAVSAEVVLLPFDPA